MTESDMHGLWIQLAANDRWHWSQQYDGYVHDLACALALPASADSVSDLDRDLTHLPDTGRRCGECVRVWREADH